MHRRRHSGAMPFFLLLVGALAAITLPAPAGAASGQPSDAAAEVAAHVRMLQQRLAELGSTIHPDLAAYAEQLRADLDAAAGANDADLTFAAIGIVRDVAAPVAGVAFHSRHAAGVTTAAQYAALSDAMAPGLLERTAALAARGWDGKPLVVRAMGEGAVARVPALIQGGRGFGADVGQPLDGLLYLGMAEGTVEFAEWLASLPLPSPGLTPSFPGLEAGISSLDAQVLAAYEDPAAQVDKHPAFIRASAALKVARRLLEDGRRAAAVLTYLEGERAVAELAATSAPVAQAEKLQALVEQLAQRIAASGGDQSIGVFYAQLAQRRLLQARSEGTDAAAISLAGAAPLLERVLPRYLELVTAGGETFAATASVDPEVTVTLVRWPFT